MTKTIIIYESIYGNTKKVADAVAEGIRESGVIECTVAKTGEVHHTDDLSRFDAIIFGSPNHNQEPSRNMLKFIERASIVDLDSKVGAAFDTYTGGNKGIAVKKLEQVIRRKMSCITFVIDSFSAQVEDRKGPLAEGEINRAIEFGKQVAAMILGKYQ
ncbi:MAG: flavodoxin family protein [Candidatus Thorarchaeota archaeon]|jgi:flavorubredoxin